MKLEHLKIEVKPKHKTSGQTIGAAITGVWVTHIPTGLIAFADSGRSQIRSKAVAMAMIEYGLAEMQCCGRCWKPYGEHTQTSGYRCPGTVPKPYETNNWTPT